MSNYLSTARRRWPEPPGPEPHGAGVVTRRDAVEVALLVLLCLVWLGGMTAVGLLDGW